VVEIRDILKHYPLECQSTAITPLGAAGGMSGALFWRINAPRGTLALRRWPVEHPTPDRLRFIHAVLDQAARHGVAVIPLPIRTTTGESFVHHAGHLWELAPWMPGAANYEREPNVDKLRAAMRALAEFHLAVANFEHTTAPDSAEGSNAVMRHLARLRQVMHDSSQELSRAITASSWPELAPLARQFLATLPRALPKAIAKLEPLANHPLPLQPCLRDIWHDHVFFTGNEVTGLIDFGAVDIDTPATDVARLLRSLAGDNASDWQIGLDAYAEVRTLSHHELLAARALDASGTILAGCNWIRWIYVERRQFENQVQVIDRFRRILDRSSNIH
jgi:homoserine kinase type II